MSCGILKDMNLTKPHVEMLAYLAANCAEVSLASIVWPYALDSYHPALALFAVGLLVGFSTIALVAFNHAKQ